MKTISHALLTFLLNFVTVSLFAQITITNTSMSGSSDTIRYSNGSPAGVNYDTTGTGMTWDFSTLTATTQDLYEYKPSAQINIAYSAFFGFSSYGLKTADSLNLVIATLKNLYDFYQNSASQFKIVGRGMEYMGLPLPSNFTDDDEVYQFPLQFGDYDSSTFAVSFSLATTLQLFQKGYRINDVVGWGSVITPYGTYNCLKVKTTIFERDSMIFNSIPLPVINRTTRQYKWLATSQKIPVFEVDGNVIGANFIATNVRYRDSFIPCITNPPSAVFSVNQTVGIVSDVFSFANTTTCATNYFWTIAPNTFNFVSGTTNTSAAPSVQFSDTGYYDVTLTAINAVGPASNLQSKYIHIVSDVGIHSGKEKDAFFVYPNPSIGVFHFDDLQATNYHWEVYTILGEKILSGKIREEKLTQEINLTGFSPGIYVVKVSTPEKSFFQKLILE